MKILSRMLSKKDEPENPGAADMELDMDGASLTPEADDSGQFNRAGAAPLPPAADPGHPVMAREEEPEVAGSGWGDAAWDEDDWDDDDWDDDEDWGDDDDAEARQISAGKKALVSEIRDAMVSVNAMRPVSENPAAEPVAGAVAQGGAGPDFSQDENFGRKAKARSELRHSGEEDRILEKTDQAMDEEGSSRRRSAMAHLKAAAAATKADRVLRHVVSRDPSADPDEQSPYRDDLAKVVRSQSASRPISRVVPRNDTRSPIWDQGTGDEDAALYAAAGDGLQEDVDGAVEAELNAQEAQRIARGPMDLSAEDFADDSPSETARVQSAFPSSPFAREATPSAPMNAFDDIGEEDFADEGEDAAFESAFADADRFDGDFDEEDDFAPRPSRVVSAAVAFANAPDEIVDETPPETEVRKAIWEAAEEVAAEVEATEMPEPGGEAPAKEEVAMEMTAPAPEPEPDPAPEAEAGTGSGTGDGTGSESETVAPLDIAAELAAAKAATGIRPPSVTPPIPDPDPVPPAPESLRVAPVRAQPAAPAAPAGGENFADVSGAVAGRAGRSAGRVKTRLLGFQANEERNVFETAKGAEQQAPSQFPAGWIVVVDGPGRGSCFTLQMGVSQIGRGEDQGVRLDFGDTSISRNNHAAVAYDDEQGKFFLGHGGKSNLVRLNGMPVLSTEEMNSGDEIRIGETTLKFVALCGEGFVWGDKGETAAE